MTLFRPTPPQRRRKGPDFWFRSIRWLAVIGWLIMTGALFIPTVAKPDHKGNIAKLAEGLRTTWDLELMKYFFYCMIVGLCISIAGFVINTKRHRRKSDEYLISLILLGFVSIVGMVTYLITF
ncbi:MAG: hypothetical protein SWH78_02355 [Thermodesulfobacteriota bacterium]|nr:hypothetical protein [Thermodesulfobacteriota bacterium]